MSRIRDRQRHNSEVLLKHASDGFDSVIDSLHDKNNDRVKWISAARTLLELLELERKIKAPDFALAYRLIRESTRKQLYNLLWMTDSKTGDRRPLPPHFFYGIKNWRDPSRLTWIDVLKEINEREKQTRANPSGAAQT